MKIEGREDAIREEPQNEMRGIDAAWEFHIQLCRDLGKQPIEDSTVEWDEEDAPFVKVGTVRVAAQDSWDPTRVERINEQTRFSIWTGIAAHQALGNINRSRGDTYRHSADSRARWGNAEPDPRSAGLAAQVRATPSLALPCLYTQGELVVSIRPQPLRACMNVYRSVQPGGDARRGAFSAARGAGKSRRSAY